MQSSVIEVADRIRRLGLQLPVIILLEAGRPFAFIAAQFVWLAQPALSLMLPSRQVANAAELLENPESVNALIEQLSREPGDRKGSA